MLSALIPWQHSYPAMPLVGQLVHQRLPQLDPLVLEPAPLRSRTPATDIDRPVSRRSEPSSRTTLMGEQPNAWDRLQPRAVVSRPLTSTLLLRVDYTFSDFFGVRRMIGNKYFLSRSLGPQSLRGPKVILYFIESIT
jgi:hypothetical protein